MHTYTCLWLFKLQELRLFLWVFVVNLDFCVSCNETSKFSLCSQEIPVYISTHTHDGFVIISGRHNKVPQTGWHRQQKFIFSEFRGQNPNQVAIWVGFRWSLTPQHVDGCLHAVSSCSLSCMFARRDFGVSFSFCNDTTFIGLGLYPCELIDLNYLPEGPPSNYSHNGD